MGGWVGGWVGGAYQSTHSACGTDAHPVLEIVEGDGGVEGGASSYWEGGWVGGWVV